MIKLSLICIIIVLINSGFAYEHPTVDFVPGRIPMELSENVRRINYTILWSLPIHHIATVGLTPVFDTLLWVSSGGRTSSADPNWILIYNLNTMTLVDSFQQATTATWGYRDMCFYNGYVYAGTEATLHKISPVPPYSVVGTYSVSGISGNVIRALTDNNLEDSLWTSNWAVPIYKFWNQGGAVRTVASNAFSIYGLAHDPRGFCWGSAQNPMSTLVKYSFPDFTVIDTATLVEITNPVGDSAIAGGCEVWRDSFVLYLGQARPLDKVYCIKPEPPPANDVGIEAILYPGSSHIPNTPMTPQGKVKNYGTATQNNFAVVCSIVNQTGSTLYTDTKIISLAPGRDTNIGFNSWTPTVLEQLTVIIRTMLVNDQNPGNDRKTSICQIGYIAQVIIGTATTNQRTEPLDRFYNYNTHEVIYRQSEINTQGAITHIAYEKHSGPDTSILDVSIYMRHTTASTLPSGTVSLPPPAPYQLVYSGSFPNQEGAGWREVQLATPFVYNNIDNLQILIVKGYQPYISTTVCPYWRYTTTSPTYLCRGARSDASQPTSLTQTYNRPNIRLTFNLQQANDESSNRTEVVAKLYAAKPNPVKIGSAKIYFTLSAPSNVNLSIYDASGRLIKTLVNSDLNSGTYSYIWNGKDDNNRSVAEG
ncbi:MAG: hypothetical protein N2748_04145, partial [candidate division WOR-3 bacterium]|nr:hypothetical protein [candidate division WOR-3 bacterium]